MRPGELRAWCLTETVPKSRNPFLVIDIADDGSVTILDDGSVTILDDGIEYTFRHHDLEMYSVKLPEADHETG